jgi:hypothetical protein
MCYLLNTQRICLHTKLRLKGLAAFGFAVITLVVVPSSVQAEIHTAASCSQADVHTAVNAAKAGDIVRLPAGTATWSNGLSIAKGIKLQGAGAGGFIGSSRTSQTIGVGTKTFVTPPGLELQAGQTVRALFIANGACFLEGTVIRYSGTSLQLNVTRTGGSGTFGAWVFAVPAQTTLINNAANDWNRALIDISEDPAASVEISGIRFQSGTATYGEHLNLHRTFGGKPVLIHDCWFTHSGRIGRGILVYNNRGLVYRCSFDGGLEEGVPGLVHTGITLKWNGEEADRSWTTPDTMGIQDTNGLNNFYVEDSYFAGAQGFDFDDNSRTVVRHCVFNNSNLATHGAETSPKGLRHFELYENTFLFDDLGEDTLNLCRWFWIRGGTGIITDNTMPDLKSRMWGDGDEIQMIVISLRRKCLYAGSPYPVPHQVGQGHDGRQPVLDPLYIWNNPGNPRIGMNDHEPDEVGLGLHTTNYIVAGRDYHVGRAKPGYAKYTYPHPLRSTGFIRNDTVWHDTSGGEIWCNGGHIIREGGLFYWVGYDTGLGRWPWRINLYSSRNLADWKFENMVILMDGPFARLGWAGRPALLHCPATGKYVIVFEADSPSQWKRHKVGFAVCDRIDGRYELAGALYPEGTRSTGDQSVYQEGDKAYVLATMDKDIGGKKCTPQPKALPAHGPS